MRSRSFSAISVSSSQDEGGLSGVQLRVRFLNSLVFGLSTTVRGDPGFVARRRPELFCKAPDHRFGICQQDVLLKSIFDRYGLRGPVWYNWILVDPAGKFVQAHAVTAKLTFKVRSLQTSQFADSFDSRFR